MMTEYKRSREQTNFEKSAELSGQVREFAKKSKSNALRYGDVSGWIQSSKQAILAQKQDCFVWIYPLLEEDESYTLEDFKSEASSEENQQKFNKEASIVSYLYQELASLPEKEGCVTVLLKKVRNTDDNSIINWRVMGKFPIGSRINDPEWDKDIVDGDENNGIIYMTPDQACSKHACSDVFKKWKSDESYQGNEDNGYYAFGYVPYTDLRSIKDRLETKSGRPIIGLVEFMDSETRATLDPEDSVVATLAGLYSNETDRLRIPANLM